MSVLDSSLPVRSDAFRANRDRLRRLVEETSEVAARTREVLALSLSAALNAPIEETRFGVFRM